MRRPKGRSNSREPWACGVRGQRRRQTAVVTSATALTTISATPLPTIASSPQPLQKLSCGSQPPLPAKSPVVPARMPNACTAWAPVSDRNVFAVGADPELAPFAVTRGLLESLDREELQGVIGHEMSHVRNLDIRAMTLVTALFGAVALLSDFARRGLYHSGGGRGRDDSRRSGDGGGGPAMIVLFILWILVAVLAPFIARLLALAVSRSREYLADASSAELTRNPLGLAAALKKIGAARQPTHLIAEGSAHLCITDPRGLKVNERDGEVAELFGTHPPLRKRIAILEEMAGVGSAPGPTG